MQHMDNTYTDVELMNAMCDELSKAADQLKAIADQNEIGSPVRKLVVSYYENCMALLADWRESDQTDEAASIRLSVVTTSWQMVRAAIMALQAAQATWCAGEVSPYVAAL